jgi:hypothetical protein
MRPRGTATAHAPCRRRRRRRRRCRRPSPRGREGPERRSEWMVLRACRAAGGGGGAAHGGKQGWPQRKGGWREPGRRPHAIEPAPALHRGGQQGGVWAASWQGIGLGVRRNSSTRSGSDSGAGFGPPAASPSPPAARVRHRRVAAAGTVAAAAGHRAVGGAAARARLQGGPTAEERHQHLLPKVDLEVCRSLLISQILQNAKECTKGGALVY